MKALETHEMFNNSVLLWGQLKTQWQSLNKLKYTLLPKLLITKALKMS